MYDTNKIEFLGEKRFLSNMYVAQIIFNFDIETSSGIIIGDNNVYTSSEHLYQALKCDNKGWRNLILSTDKPEVTKNLAKKKLKTLLADNVSTFLIREDWHDIKLFVMQKIVQEKFIQNKELFVKLQNVHGHIEEKNCWGDKYWGTVDGIGENNLGKILMKIRDTK